jgi:hypothetical protein
MGAKRVPVGILFREKEKILLFRVFFDDLRTQKAKKCTNKMLIAVKVYFELI